MVILLLSSPVARFVSYPAGVSAHAAAGKPLRHAVLRCAQCWREYWCCALWQEQAILAAFYTGIQIAMNHCSTVRGCCYLCAASRSLRVTETRQLLGRASADTHLHSAAPEQQGFWYRSWAPC